MCLRDMFGAFTWVTLVKRPLPNQRSWKLEGGPDQEQGRAHCFQEKAGKRQEGPMTEELFWMLSCQLIVDGIRTDSKLSPTERPQPVCQLKAYSRISGWTTAVQKARKELGITGQGCPDAGSEGVIFRIWHGCFSQLCWVNLDEPLHCFVISGSC